jgi:hypothetical protein
MHSTASPVNSKRREKRCNKKIILSNRVINATNKDGGGNAGQLLDVVEESAVFIDRSMR